MPENQTTPGEFRIGRPVAGRYRVISKLGEGGMGITYRAWDERESRPVVLKMPRHTLFGNPAFAERFRREVRMMSALSHPSIVPILDVGDEQGLPFLTMRFLPGGSLSNRRLRDADGKVLQMQPSTLHLWLRAVASALDFVHSNGIVHRDVKPANIFFDSYWGAYLGDFGIAKIVEDTTVLEKEQTLTATSMAIGTQEYMAPEQFTPKAVVDGRVDQYAVAVMVYEILCGQRPFKGDSAHLIVEVTTQQVPRVTDFRRDLPESLCRALYKGLAKTPEERFANCSGFAAAVLHDVRPMADEEGVARLLCPQCGNMLKMPPSAAGRQGKCPRCKTEMMVAGDMTAVWLAREERKASESGSASTAGRTVDTDDVFTSISSETVMTKPASGGFLSQLSPTVQRFGIGAVALTCFVIGALLGGDHAGSDAREQLAASMVEQRVFLAESDRLRTEVKSLTQANLKLRRDLEIRAAQKPQSEEKATDAAPANEPLREVEKAASVAVRNSVGMEFITIPKSTFIMGSPEGEDGRRPDENQVQVTLTCDFLLAKAEVTRAQWQQVMGTKPWASVAGAAEDEFPATHMSWEDATAFCKKLTVQDRGNGTLPTSEEYRLPTEAEWEHACRAGTRTAFSFGNDVAQLGGFAWYRGNAGMSRHSVGATNPNPWGLYDMHGNVWEWCADLYTDKLSGGADPAGPASSAGSSRVLRGGSWDSTASSCRSAFRDKTDQLQWSGNLGFRVARGYPLPKKDLAKEPITEGERSSAPPPPKTEGNSVGMTLLEIPAGTFQMGTGTRAVTATLSRAFWLGTTEVTQGQWEKVIGKGSGNPVATKVSEGLPMVHVSWVDATKFCKKLTGRERSRGFLPANEEYRLPTEAEWEYACSAGQKSVYSFGNDASKLSGFAWFAGNAGGMPHPVGTASPNLWGLHDMHGNVWEWCLDCYDDSLRGGADPVGHPVSGASRVLRGGSWKSSRASCGSAVRNAFGVLLHSPDIGFRVARGPSTPRTESTAEAEQSPPKLPLKTVVNSADMTLLEIPAGTFQMGEGGSAVAVTLSRTFWLGKTEVTQEQWQNVMGISPDNSTEGKAAANLPIVNVSWNDVTEFCKKLTDRERAKGVLRTGENYQLPTEAEWEYACRAGTATRISFGDGESKLGDFAWFTANAEGAIHPVATKKPNPWGLYDMYGNAHEWCLDWWGGELPGGIDPLGPAEGSARVGRGGSWRNGPVECRSAYRYGDPPSYRSVHMGFRVARSHQQTED